MKELPSYKNVTIFMHSQYRETQQDVKAIYFEKIFYGLSLHVSVFSIGTQMPVTYILYNL